MKVSVDLMNHQMVLLQFWHQVDSIKLIMENNSISSDAIVAMSLLPEPQSMISLVRVTPEGLIYAVDLASAVTGYGINKAHRFLGNRKFSKSKYKKHANRKLLTPKAAIQLIWACAKNHS